MTAQTSATQLPLTQMPASQWMSAHGSGGWQKVAQVVPDGHSPAHAV